MPGRSGRSGPAQPPQRLLQGIDLPFIVDLLPLRQLEGFQHFLHLVERLFERFDNLRHFFNRPGDGGGRGFNFSFGQCRRAGRRTRRGNWFRSTRAAATATAMAATPSTAGTSRRRGRICFRLLFLRHCRCQHDAPPDKSKGEL